MTNFDSTTYTITETADKLSLSEKTLRRWEEAGRFCPTRTVGNQRRYSLEDLQILDAIKHNIISHQKELLNTAAAAQFLGVTESTLDRLVAEGKLHPFVTVQTTYYPRHRLLPLLQEFKDKPQSIAKPLVHADEAPATPLIKPLQTPAQRATPRDNYLSQYTPYFIHIMITLTILTTYHLVFNQKTSTVSPTPDVGSVQGASTNPSLQLLDDMLDPSTGGITATTVISKLGTTTPNLTLLPGIAPTSPYPGSLYYDASENVLKIYGANGWQAITTASELNALQFDLESKIATTSTQSN